MRSVDTRYGPLVVPDLSTDLIGRFLDRYGEWGWLEAEFVAGVLGERPRILDGGAFVGTFGLGVGLCKPLQFACFVEANPDLGPVLEENVTSKIADVVVVSGLIGRQGRVVEPGWIESGNLGSATFDAAAPEGGTAAVVPERVVTLGELRERYGAFDLIKLDLEGMELEALQSDAEFLSMGQTALWLECNEDRRSLQVVRQLLAWGLPVFYFASPAFNAGNVNGDPVAVFPMAYEAGLLAAPARVPSLTEALEARGCILKPIRTVHDLRLAMWATPRWGMAEWETATKPEIAALAGRALRSESFDLFLRDHGAATAASGVSPSSADAAAVATLTALLEDERASREQVETSLGYATKLALERLDELTVERGQREAAEAGLREAEQLALARLDEIGVAGERLAATERELDVARGLALERLDALAREGGRREEVEAALKVAEGLAFTRLDALDVLAARQGELSEELGVTKRLLAEQAAAQVQERQRAATAETELSRASARALAHLAALGRARDEMELLEADVARLGPHAAEVLRLTGVEADLRAALARADALHAEFHDRARTAEAVIAIYQASSVWRISAPARAFIGKRPYLRALARRGRQVTGLVLSRLRS